MKRYVVGSRRRPHLAHVATVLASHPSARVVTLTPGGRHVVELTEFGARELAARNPQLVVEEDHRLTPFPMPQLPTVVLADDGVSLQVSVRDAATGRPIPDVTIFGIGETGAYKASTNALGQATLYCAEAQLARAIVSPRDGYWSRVVPDVDIGRSRHLSVDLRRLPLRGAFSWGHRLMGFPRVASRWRGRGIKIAIVDSGISSLARDVRPAGGLNTLHGQDSRLWNVDEEGHGTHCAGVVAALDNSIGVRGGAPDALVYSLKVFPEGYLSDLVAAVEWCAANGIDVVSMSLGSQAPSPVLAQVLADAWSVGITCVAAVGNDSTRVAYPAGFPTVIGVGAIGRFGAFPPDSAHALRVGGAVDWSGMLFSAGFTNFGPELDIVAPGVAIVSTVPSGYAAWDGTSMACPYVAALAALVLERYPRIRTGDGRQPESVRAILRASAADLGMPPFLQGYGLPLATQALGVSY